MRQSSGFTLIELIIVVVLIGVLSVVALPKFIDFSGDASQATFRSTASAFKSGVEFIHLILHRARRRGSPPRHHCTWAS